MTAPVHGGWLDEDDVVVAGQMPLPELEHDLVAELAPEPPR